MARYIYISMLILSRILPITNDETGWSYNQSTAQCFYMFESITIGGELAQSGESSDDGPGDVVGAFLDGECVGWTYVLESYTTLPLMGDDGSNFTDGYIDIGGAPDEIMIYDVSTGLTFPLTTTIEFPSWSPNDIKIIPGESYVDVSYGCTDQGACNFDQDAVTDDGSCYYPINLCTSCASYEGAGDGDNLGGYDCLGDCDGSAELDECGVCDGGGIPDGQCDCEGNILDCAGQCDGSAELDECGECIDGSQSDSYECIEGCDGLWYNDGQEPTEIECDSCLEGLDLCGVCGGNDSCIGCMDNGQIDGSPFQYPACNYSESYTINNFASCEYGHDLYGGNPGDYDCAGTCLVEIDECGVCGGNSSSCLDNTNVMVPDIFSIIDSYPNPFNPLTTIRFQLPGPSNVNLDIYNLSGELVFSNDFGSIAQGTYSYNFNADGLASGPYFIVLSSLYGADSHKIFLMK